MNNNFNSGDIIDEFLTGQSFRAYEKFGGHLINGGAEFVTYAPNALNVELCINGNVCQMNRNERGVWQIFIGGAKAGDIYQYIITTKSFEKYYRADPFAFYSEVRPESASILSDLNNFGWSDNDWMSARDKCYEKPLNIYEVHLGSWKVKFDDEDNDERFYSYEEMCDVLIPYVKDMGYTHIELMPITEHPYDGSWGYQATGYFSPTSRYGSPYGLKCLINACHRADIGVILDFVPVHFARDFFGLHLYDGGCVFESDNENERYSEWNTALFDYSKPHVLSFMKSAVNFWIEEYHIDGIRFDAVAYLIYKYGRKENPINDSGIWFMKNTNYTIGKMHPDVMLFAEDSTDYLKVTAPVEYGGLGFDYKWDLGYMNDTINYIKTPPAKRAEEHHKMTFSMSYFYNDLFILPFSHDEVVHGKKTMIDKVYGTHKEKLATIKAFYTFQFCHPGKKLNFMGNELGEYMEWRCCKELGWNLLEYPDHDSLHEYIKALNHLYLSEPALYKADYNSASFRWIDANNSRQNIFAFRRNDLQGRTLYMVFNFSDKLQKYKLKVEENGEYRELLNSDRDIYAGGNCLNGIMKSQKFSLDIKLAPFSSVIISM